MRRLLKDSFVIGSMAFVAVACLTAAKRPDVEHDQLEARADRVFSYDREHAAKLPAHKLRALSVAITFHDDNGARQLLDQLERLI